MDKCILDDFTFQVRGRIKSGHDTNLDYFCGTYKPVCNFHDCSDTTCYCTEFDFKFELSEQEREESWLTQKGDNLMMLELHQHIEDNDIDLDEDGISPEELKENYLYAREETAIEIIERFREASEQYMDIERLGGK